MIVIYFIIGVLFVLELIVFIFYCMFLEEEKYYLKNFLFIVCKIGDVDILRNLLVVLL